MAGLILATLCVLGGYHFYIQMDVIYPQDVAIVKKNTDLRVATAGQYTIQLQFKKSQIENFMKGSQCDGRP